MFKVGDKVRVTDNLKDIKGFHGGYMDEMDELIGQIVTIDSIDGDEIYVKEDPHGYVWDKRAFVSPIMNKNELKIGDIVKLRNGEELIYIDEDTFTDLSSDPTNGLCDLGDLTDDMKYSGYGHGSENDVIEVKRPASYNRVFVRDETIKEMTLKEVCEALGYEVKIIKEEE